ncbi:hypothetical protein J4462_04755 [Candidatus Pacearchaeota archaeon]|nr:hypothetical protein [Candidatus Pacearchaeota archaeon]
MKNSENNIALAVVIALVILLAISGLGTRGFSNWGMGGMMPGFYGGFGFMWLFGWLIMILVMVALFLFILWLIKQLQGDKLKK